MPQTVFVILWESPPWEGWVEPPVTAARKEKALPCVSHSSSLRAMEGPSATKEFCPPDTSESQLSLRNVVQITVVKAQDLVKLFWKCLSWFNQ